MLPLVGIETPFVLPLIIETTDGDVKRHGGFAVDDVTNEWFPVLFITENPGQTPAAVAADPADVAVFVVVNILN